MNYEALCRHCRPRQRPLRRPWHRRLRPTVAPSWGVIRPGQNGSAVLARVGLVPIGPSQANNLPLRDHAEGPFLDFPDTKSHTLCALSAAAGPARVALAMVALRLVRARFLLFAPLFLLFFK